jgi:peroxiredoxin/tetratricopeptide (TPR) repeat protein
MMESSLGDRRFPLPARFSHLSRPETPPMPKSIRLGLALACLSILPARADEPQKPTAPASEANPAVPAAGHSIHGEAFNDGPRQRAHIMPGQGKIDFPVTTPKPEAQAFVNQGVGQLHSFFYLEAERSFRTAAQIDPACPMAYWGMAMANVNNAKRAKGFLKEAEAKVTTTKITRREQLYIDALVALYKDGVDLRNQKNNHLLGLETIVQEFPSDIDARAWMAMVTWQNESMGGGIGSRQAVDTVIDTVLDRESLHPGAHHYRIHLWDSKNAARAEKSAGLFARSAPGIAHAWHMPGHTYTGLKRYADAAYQQEGSARVDHAYMLRDRVMPFEIHNYTHNNQWLSTSLSHVGRARDAILVARNLVEQPRDPNKNGPNDGGSSQRSGRLRWVEALVKYELWDDLIAATTSGTLDWTDIAAEQKEKHHSLGLAYAARGDLPGLASEITALRAMVEKETPKPPAAPATPAAPASRPVPATLHVAGGGSGAAPALAELEGYELNAKGDYLGALEKFKASTTIRPESLARAHLSARNFGLAESAAMKAVEAGPNQVLPLATLVEALHAAGKDKEAREAYKKLEPIARHADRDTPIFRRLAPIVDAWKAQGNWGAPAPETPTDETIAATRVDLETVGPLGWTPSPAPPLVANDTDGKAWKLDDHKGRNVVVLFYLGNKCAHCMQQLEAFGKEHEALKKLNTDVVAVGTDDPDAAKSLKANQEGIKFPMPILADPKLALFRSFGAHDDFEGTPMHGTFLIDAKGAIRFIRISSDPFLDVEFIKKESARVSKLLK